MKYNFVKIINLIILATILIAGCKKKNRLPNTPYTPFGPYTGAISDTYLFSSLANDPDGDSVGLRFDWGDGDTSDWSSLVATEKTVSMLHSWQDSGTYYVKAQAKDNGELTSEWSLPHSVVIGPNIPPNPPTIPNGPSTGYIDVPYQFSSSAIDPDGEIVIIRFAWGDGKISDWSVWQPNGDSFWMFHYWSDTGTYYVKAQAMDTGELTSKWSDVHPIKILHPNLKWCYYCGEYIISSPAVGPDGTIYFAGIIAAFDNKSKARLWAINPDGTFKWKYPTGGGPSSPAIGPDGTIYVGSGGVFLGGGTGRQLWAINPDGTLKWVFETGDWVESSPAVSPDGTIYVGSGDKYLYAINPDGSLKWQYEIGGEVVSSPAVGSDGTIYVGSCNNYFYALNSDGSLRWRYQTGDDVMSSPAIDSDGSIHVGSNNECLHTLYSTGVEKWRYLTQNAIQSSPAIASDGTIYVGSHDKCLYAINPDGTLKWVFETKGGIRSSPAVGSDSTIYFGSYDSCFYALYPNGCLKWKYKTKGPIASSPVIGSDGSVYVGSVDRRLYAFYGSGTLANTAWPMFHHDIKHTGRVGGGRK